MIYLDTSALVKLAIRENESHALSAYLLDKPIACSSSLSTTELRRAIRRVDASLISVVDAVLHGLRLIPVTSRVVESAGLLDPVALRSLDAVHIASALLLREELVALVSYDERMLAAARSYGLATASPS